MGGVGDRGAAALSAAVARAATRLTGQHVELLASFLAGAASPAQAIGARALVATPRFRSIVDELMASWRKTPEVSGAELAFGLRAAYAAADRARETEKVELVATGPRTRLVPIRSSEEVLLELIGQARHRLLIISFATFRVPVVRAALVTALDRGVAVTMLLEDADLGELRSGNAYADLAPRVRMLAWPADQRASATGPTRPKMHAKAAAVDGERAFITSANLTGAGLETNLELGTLVSGGDLPGALERHVGELLRAGVLAVVT